MPEDYSPQSRRGHGLRESTGRTGITLGLLVLALAALAFYFFWSRTGARTPEGKRPPPPVVLQRDSARGS